MKGLVPCHPWRWKCRICGQSITNYFWTFRITFQHGWNGDWYKKVHLYWTWSFDTNVKCHIFYLSVLNWWYPCMPYIELQCNKFCPWCNFVHKIFFNFIHFKFLLKSEINMFQIKKRHPECINLILTIFNPTSVYFKTSKEIINIVSLWCWVFFKNNSIAMYTM